MNKLLTRLRDAEPSPGRPRRFAPQLLLLAGGLLALWLLIQVVPQPATPSVAPDDATSDAVGNEAVAERSVAVLTPGRIAVIVLLLGGAGWAVYLHRRSSNSSGTGALIETMGTLPLSQDQQLRLVCCNDEVLLIGVTSSEIRLLKSYPRTSFVAGDAPSEHGTAACREDPGTPSPVFPRFAEILRQYGHLSTHE